MDIHSITDDMYWSYKLRIKVDRDYSNLPKSYCCNAFFIEDTNICSECGNRALAICDECDGSGDVLGKVYGHTITPPYKRCPKCFGSGKVELEL